MVLYLPLMPRYQSSTRKDAPLPFVKNVMGITKNYAWPSLVIVGIRWGIFRWLQEMERIWLRAIVLTGLLLLLTEGVVRSTWESIWQVSVFVMTVKEYIIRWDTIHGCIEMKKDTHHQAQAYLSLSPWTQYGTPIVKLWVSIYFNILGIDWLYSYYACIDCRNCIIKF